MSYNYKSMDEKDYSVLIVLTSKYHGWYFEQQFKRNGVKNYFREAPRKIAKSCHTAIYIKKEDLDKAITLINKVQVKPQGIFEIIRGEDGRVLDYKRVQI